MSATSADALAVPVNPAAATSAPAVGSSGSDASVQASDAADAQKKGWRAWIGRGIWGFVDMGLFAGGNFLTHVFLARWLPEAVYGAFTTAFAIYLFFAVIHTSVVIEPMMVYGSRRYRRRLPAYLGNLIRLHAWLCVGYAVVLGMIAVGELLMGESELGGAVSMFAVAQFALLLPWILRDACYIISDPKPAGLAGMIYLAVVLIGLYSLQTMGWLSLPTAVGLLGTAALLASAWLVYRLQLVGHILAHGQRLRWARHRHWRFGRWSLLTNFIRYVPEHMPLVVVPMVLGYASGGALKALVNLVTPFILVTWALSNLLLPVLVQRTGNRDFERFAVRITLLVMLGPLLCWPVLGWFGQPIVEFLYDGKFGEHAWALWLLGLLPVVISVNCILCSVYRALDRPNLILPSAIIAAATVFAIGLPLLWLFGLWGMVAGMLFGQVLQSVMLLITYVKRLRGRAIGTLIKSKSNAEPSLTEAVGSSIPGVAP